VSAVASAFFTGFTRFRVAGNNRTRVLSAVGLRDMAVVVTDKATLVLPLDRSQDVRAVVAEVQRLGRSDLL
jgi:hypothetical protein